MIASDSVSYPYLAVALRFNVDHGTVLSYVDFLEGRNGDLGRYWQQKAIAVCMDKPVGEAIRLALASELRRRYELLGTLSEQQKFGAGDGNRTRVDGVEGRGSTIELRPQTQLSQMSTKSGLFEP